MEAQDVIDVTQEAIYLGLLIGAPVLLVGMLIGLIISLLQALTQIQDQTISFVPKIVAMVLALSFCLPWIVQRMVEYSESLFQSIPRMVMGG